MNQYSIDQQIDFFSGDSEMARLTRARDWSKTSLGDVESWPQSLRTTLSIILNSKFPMFLWWGPELICFYNDAYRPSLGINGKHPGILGIPAVDAWPEIWVTIKPLIDQVLAGKGATWSEDQLIPIYRNGHIEDVYWTFSYSQVNDESGKVAGVLVTCTETTDKINTYKKLQESKDQLQFAIEAAELATWDFDPATNKFTSNERLKEWFGLPPGKDVDLPLAISSIAIKDRERITKAIQKALDFSSGGNYDDEYTIIHPVTKKETIVRAKGKAFFNEKHIAYRFNGTLEDVTEKVLYRKEKEEGEKRFRNTVKQAPVGISILRGPDFFVEMANENYLELVSRTEKDFVGFPLFVGLPEVKEAVEPILTNVMKTGEPFYGREFPVIINRFGKESLSYFDFTYHPLREDNGTISGIIVVVTEVTASVKAKHSLAESEKQFRNLVMQSPIPMTIVKGKDHVIEIANTAMYENIWRKNEADVIGRSILDVFPELREQKYPELMDNVFTSGEYHRENESLVYVQGNNDLRKFYLDYEYAPLFGKDNMVEGIIITVSDVTEKVEARQKLEESERRLNIVIEASELGTWEYNLQSGVLTYSEKYLSVFGFKEGSILEHSEVLSRIHSDDLVVRKEAFRIAYETGVLHYKARIILDNGSARWIENRGKVFYDKKNIPLKITGTSRDITEEKNYQLKLEEREQKFRLLADSMPQFIWTGDAEGKLNYFNQSVYQYSGLTAEQIEKDGWLQIIHPDEREENTSKWLNSVQTGEDFLFEHRFRSANGEYRWQLSRAIPQRDINGEIQMWVGTSTDIEEQKTFTRKLEELVEERTRELKELNDALRKSEERYHLMVEEVQDYAILYLNRNGIVENWNKGAEKIKGYKSGEIIGKNFSIFYSKIDKEDGLPARLLNIAAKEGRAVHEGWRNRKDGTAFWASVVITAVHDEQKNVIGFSKVTHDLTEKKEAEDLLKRNADELERKNKELQLMNTELQSFAYVSSHDLQEPLRKIQVFATMINQNEEEQLSEKTKDYLGRMQNAAARMQTLINDLLAYSRTNLTERNFEKTDLNKILDEVKAELKDEIQQKNATIESGELCEVAVIPFQFQQLLMNLVGNALKFSKVNVTPHILVKAKVEPPGSLDIPELQKDKAYCHVSVSDNGIGFEPQYHKRIFEVFQRLHGKAEYKGTGIGLAIVKKIVENHNGIIKATGELDKGATFDIYFPIS